jgi:hypothetical protein
LGVFVIGLALAGWAVFSLGDEGNDFAIASPGELYGNTQFGQTFVASYPKLYRIDIVMSTYDRRNTKDVIFHLKQNLDAQADIVSITLDATDVRDKAWQSFIFPPLSDSMGQSYYLYLESPESEPGDAMTVMGRDGDPYPSGQGYINHHPVAADMAFRVYYKVDPIQKINIVLESLAANKPTLWGSKAFYMFLAAVYVLLVGALIWEISANRA